jgi:hypothetical protein
MSPGKLAQLALGGALLLGCDGQQYVSPNTVALVVTDDGTQMQRVNRCQYIPVLAGSRVVFRYEVDSDIKATLVIDRNEVRVVFEPEGVADAFEVDAEDLTDDQRFTADGPPDGYQVELVAGCTPDDEYE